MRQNDTLSQGIRKKYHTLGPSLELPSGQGQLQVGSEGVAFFVRSLRARVEIQPY